jgi:3-deoxy-7-phosphoheptulonate synthase
VSKKYKLVSRDFKPEDTVIEVKGVKIGGGNIPVMAGPCAVESYDQFHAVVSDLTKLGIKIIRAMVYKPRTSTYDFQGLKEEGIRVLREVKKDFPDVAFITEVPGPNQIEGLMDVTDIFQVGARNSQNYDLLERLGKAGKPVILKRGLAGTVEEWLQSAEYLMANGCTEVILCERGIRTYETITRNTLDLGALAATKRLTHLPIVADPSHGGGKLELVIPLSRAALGAGCDGLLVEAHPDPKHAYSDAAQQIPSATFGDYLEAIKPWHELAQAMRRA